MQISHTPTQISNNITIPCTSPSNLHPIRIGDKSHVSPFSIDTHYWRRTVAEAAVAVPGSPSVTDLACISLENCILDNDGCTAATVGNWCIQCLCVPRLVPEWVVSVWRRRVLWLLWGRQCDGGCWEIWGRFRLVFFWWKVFGIGWIGLDWYFVGRCSLMDGSMKILWWSWGWKILGYLS